jgi:hypothetical protein
MPNTTKKIISDQLLLRLSGGFRDTAYPVDERDIWKALEQLINGVLNLQYFSVTLPNGETIPENLMVATYENVAVTSTTVNKSSATLPVMPIALPRNLGIVSVYDPNFPDSPFIPIMRGQTALLKTDSLLSDMLGQVSYEPKGRTVIFNQDLPLNHLSAVTMELMVMDISLYGIHDVLPIPADYEAGIIEKLYQQFSSVAPETGQVNNYSTIAEQPTKPIK